MALNVGINFGHGRLLPLLLVMLLVERFYCSVNSGKKCHRATATEARVKVKARAHWVRDTVTRRMGGKVKREDESVDSVESASAKRASWMHRSASILV